MTFILWWEGDLQQTGLVPPAKSFRPSEAAAILSPAAAAVAADDSQT